MKEVKIVEKPWGREVIYANNFLYIGKILEVNAGHSLSLQYHRQKHETMYILEGKIIMTLGKQRNIKNVGDVIEIPPMMIHRVEAAIDSKILEVSSGHLDDLVRVEDAYGRD
jgi:mannose-1-phosphate guanylyltransferase